MITNGFADLDLRWWVVSWQRNDKKWDESRTYNIMASYMRPILLWIGIILICRYRQSICLGTSTRSMIRSPSSFRALCSHFSSRHAIFVGSWPQSFSLIHYILYPILRRLWLRMLLQNLTVYSFIFGCREGHLIQLCWAQRPAKQSNSGLSTLSGHCQLFWLLPSALQGRGISPK